MPPSEENPTQCIHQVSHCNGQHINIDFSLIRTTLSWVKFILKMTQDPLKLCTAAELTKYVLVLIVLATPHSSKVFCKLYQDD